MAEKDLQLGIVLVIIATFFLLSGMELTYFRFFDERFSFFFAFVLVAVGIYKIAKK